MPGNSHIAGHSTTDMNDYTDSPEAIAFTRIPNEWIDRAMPTMSAAEWMVATIILRQTIGWHKERDTISLSQFQQKTGLARHTCIKALRSLISARWIKAYEHGIRTVYEPSFADGAETAPPVTSAETAPELVQKLHHTSAETAPKVVQKLHTQKKERKKKERKKTLTRADAHVAHEHAMKSISSEEQPKPKRESTVYGDLFVRIAAISHIDPKIGKHAKQIASTAKYLEARGVTPDRVDAFATWWSLNDFRGKRGEYPYPSVIAELWLRFEEGQTATSSTPTPSASGMQSRYATTTTSKSGTFRRGQAMFTDEQRAAAEAEAARMLAELEADGGAR